MVRQDDGRPVVVVIVTPRVLPGTVKGPLTFAGRCGMVLGLALSVVGLWALFDFRYTGFLALLLCVSGCAITLACHAWARNGSANDPASPYVPL